MEDNLFFVNMAKANIPKPTESKNTSDDKWVTWGNNNLYPEYLLRLYNESPSHGGIVDQKTVHIIGDGLVSADGKPVSFQANTEDTIEGFLRKITLDFVLYSAFAVEVRKNALGQVVDYIPVPVHKLRMNKSKSKYWFLDDWSFTNSKKHIIFDEWNHNDDDSTSKIFYFQSYRPSLSTVYSSPDYLSGNVAIETDIAIRNFHLNNIKNNFSPSSIISFFKTGNFTSDQKEATRKGIKENFSGEGGEKILLDFQSAEGKAAEVKQLSSNDWADAYQVTRKDVNDDIHSSHAYNPLLSGNKTEGSLGNSQELEIAFEIFQGGYLQVKRNELEAALNYLFSTNPAIGGNVSFKKKPLLSKKLADSVKEKVMTIDELRAEAGLASLPNGQGQRLLSVSPAPAQDMNEHHDHAEEKKAEVKKKLTGEDYDKIAHLGVSASDFDIIEEFDQARKFRFDLQSDIASYVIDNDIKDLTLPQLRGLLVDAGIDATVNQIRDILKDLNDSGIVKVSYDDENKVKVDPQPKPDVPDTDTVQVMYKYELRPGIQGPIKRNSRDFCVRVIDNNRLYTRAEIQQMSGIFEYDIARYGGGFYHNPNTGITTPYCRHFWKAYSVKRKA